MTIIWTIIIGFVIGLVARALMPGRDPGGFIVTSLLGIAGSVVAKYIGQALRWYGPEDAAGFFMSVLGAMLLLFVYHRFFSSRTTGTTATSGL